jgi:hypothetical protein
VNGPRWRCGLSRQLAEFLRFVADDPLFALWWLVALRGLRRGEVAGLRWQDIDLDRRQLTIVSQRTTVGYQVVEGPPKSAASRRTVALDRRTVTVLRAHLRHRREWYAATGRRWRADGYVFTRPDGRAYHPNYLTHRLRFLINAAGLPPVLLHYLRHGAASLAHTAGADIKTSRTSSGAPGSCTPRHVHHRTAGRAAQGRRGHRPTRPRRGPRRPREDHRSPPPRTFHPTPAEISHGTASKHPTTGQTSRSGQPQGQPPATQGKGNRSASTTGHRPRRTKRRHETAGRRVGRRGFEPRTYGLEGPTSVLNIRATSEQPGGRTYRAGPPAEGPSSGWAWRRRC